MRLRSDPKLRAVESFTWWVKDRRFQEKYKTQESWRIYSNNIITAKLCKKIICYLINQNCVDVQNIIPCQHIKNLISCLVFKLNFFTCLLGCCCSWCCCCWSGCCRVATFFISRIGRSNRFSTVSASGVNQLTLFGIKIVDKVGTGIREEEAGILADRVGGDVFKESNNVALIITPFRVVKLEHWKDNLFYVKAPSCMASNK